MSVIGRAKSASQSLSKANSFVVIVNVLLSIVVLIIGFVTLGEDSSIGFIWMAVGAFYFVSSLLMFHLIESFSAHVQVGIEMLKELEKANGYK